jgi:RNA polymerase sigma-70 factor (ECF subfamily)
VWCAPTITGESLTSRTPIRPDADAELAAATAAGDADAFEQLVRKYERPVLSTIYRYVGDRVAAEDVAQEAFLKVWRRAKSFKGRSSFSTWLYRVVVNECLNFRRKRSRAKNVPLDELLAEGGPGLEERLEAEKKAAAVRAAVAELPARQRMALILSKFEGRSYREIGAMMRTSTSSVESLIFRAKNNLMKKLLPLKEAWRG